MLHICCHPEGIYAVVEINLCEKRSVRDVMKDVGAPRKTWSSIIHRAPTCSRVSNLKGPHPLIPSPLRRGELIMFS